MSDPASSDFDKTYTSHHGARRLNLHQHRSDHSRDTMRDILADLNATPRIEEGEVVDIPHWGSPVPVPGLASSSTSSGNAQSASFSRHDSASRPPLPQKRTSSSGQGYSSSPQVPPNQAHPTLFNTPPRSIFSSGPPTASLSASTAHASISSSASQNQTHPLSSLAGQRPIPARRSSSQLNHGTRTPRTVEPPLRAMTTAEKDVDDPSSGSHREQAGSRARTLATLNNLFSATTIGTTPDFDHPKMVPRISYFRTSSGNPVPKALFDSSSLAGHLLNEGLLSGKHSDITIKAFGQRYALHRLLLDRAPFFSSLLSGHWADSATREVELHPEEIDSNITQTAFELALKGIYGSSVMADEDQEAIGLFATACWLEMSDLVEACVDSLLRQMEPSKLPEYIHLVTSNYYGKSGERILASCKAMLFRDGWEMPLHYWDSISADIIREIVGGDAFYVPDEWDRLILTVKLLNRRLRAAAVEAGLISTAGEYLAPLPSSIKFFAVRFDEVYRRNSTFGGRHISAKDESWIALYTSPNISPLLVLLDEGIYYMHLPFAQLQQIRSHRDCLGVPIVPEEVITHALWSSMELRQRVVNVRENDLELGLSEEAQEYDYDDESDGDAVVLSAKAKGKMPEAEDSDIEDMASGSWDGNGKPRKFWIPGSDNTVYLGGRSESWIAANQNMLHPRVSRLSSSLEPTDIQWASDFVAAGADPASNVKRFSGSDQGRPSKFSLYPPFRFCAEFPNPRTLKEKKRVYSQTVWYAGSMWNLYIQRVATSKTQQLGIYLHRAKEKDVIEDYANGLAMKSGSTGDRLTPLGREMYRRRLEQRSSQWRAFPLPGAHSNPLTGDDDSTAHLNSDEDTTLVDPESTDQLLRASGQTSAQQVRQAEADFDPSSSTPEKQATSGAETGRPVSSHLSPMVPALPPYTDARPTIKTYFKIYSPSREGRMLSIYESAPDKFNFSQSWGWKTSLLGTGEEGGAGVVVGGLDDGVMRDGSGEANGKEKRLRYMVVIGNV